MSYQDSIHAFKNGVQVCVTWGTDAATSRTRDKPFLRAASSLHRQARPCHCPCLVYCFAFFPKGKVSEARKVPSKESACSVGTPRKPALCPPWLQLAKEEQEMGSPGDTCCFPSWPLLALHSDVRFLSGFFL